jgi:hypothetical protein
MLYNAILSLTLFLPLNHALSISSHLSTETTLQCSTLYSTSSPSLLLLTTTASLSHTIDLSPVILHNYTTSTITKTPKPFQTLFSVLATKTRTVEREAVDGVLRVEVTRFGTKTFWHHVTTTATVTKERFLTSRTTTWISAPSGFVGVRDGSEAKGEVKHPHTKRQFPSTSKKPLARPTQGKYAVAVHCERQIRIHTTQVLLLTASKKATVTAKRETVFKNRTVYGTVTSTILALPSINTTVDSISEASGSGYSSGISSAPSKSSGAKHTESTLPTVSSIPTPSTPSTISSPPKSQNLAHIITITTTTLTKTPYTISFTYTATTTTTSTATLHATTTITSFAACASANLLGQTSGMLRVNGVSFSDDEGGVEGKDGVEDARVEGARVEQVETETAALCCETCIQKQGCLWSIYEASGEKKGSCYLVLSSSGHQGAKDKNMEQKGGKEVVDATKTGICTKQEKRGTFGYSGGNGEVGYVVSNGLCGMLLEA